MNEDASYALQKAVVEALRVDAAVVELLGPAAVERFRVYDDVPISAEMPYAVVGDDDENSVDAEAVPGSGHQFVVHVMAAAVDGYREAKTIAGAIKRALNGKDIAVPGFDGTTVTWRATAHRRNPDKATLRQSSVLFYVELRPNL